MELLCMQFRGIGPHFLARVKSHDFSQVAAGTWAIFTSYSRDDPLKLVFLQQCQDSCLVRWDTCGISSKVGMAIRTLLQVRQETQVPFLVATVIWGFLSTFNKSQASSPFEALNSECLSRCHRHVMPPVQMRRGHRAFSRVSTEDSDNPSSCEMKDKPAFKPLQGNLAFRVKASRCTFHLRQETQGPSHIPIALRSLLLRCLWKVGLTLQMKPGNQLSSQDDMGCTELSSSFCAEIGVPLDMRRVSQGISGVA